MSQKPSNNKIQSINGVSELDNEERLTLSDAELIASPISLPCGRVVPNRLVKAAMYEHLSSFSGGPPNQYHLSLYSAWARGEWGMIITGNCQISSSHLTFGRDLTYTPSDNNQSLNAYRALADAIHSRASSDIQKPHETLAILQLSHSGRQSPRFIGGRLGTFQRPLAPSSRRVGDDTREGWLARLAYKIFFETPLTISSREIEEVIDEFVNAAQMAVQAGFDGVQLHASHGYMLSQFLSPKLNTRTDEYSEPLQIIRRIIERIRAVVSPRFALGIKLNAGDYVTGGLSEEQALEHVREIALLSVDFIEISGGSYENPNFMISTSPSLRQAFFSSFSRLVVEALPASLHGATPLIMLTGSLRTPSQFARILRQKHAHLLGLARLSVLCPDLPHLISPSELESSGRKSLNFPLVEPELFNPRWFPKLLGAGVVTAWYVVGIRHLGRNREADLRIGSLGAVFWMWCWEGPSGSVGSLSLILLIIAGTVGIKLLDLSLI